MDSIKFPVQDSSESFQDDVPVISDTLDAINHKQKHKVEMPKNGKYIIVDHIESMDLGLLPEGWTRLRHISGLTIYQHRPTRVVTLSRPYGLGSGNIRYHRIPVTALPCLAYRRACSQRSVKNEDPAVDADNLNDSRVDSTPPVNTQSADLSVEDSDPRCPFMCSPKVAFPNRLADVPDVSAELPSSKQDREEGELSSGDEDDDFFSSAVPPKKMKLEQQTPKKKPVQSTPNQPPKQLLIPAAENMPSPKVSVVSVKPGPVTEKRRRRRRPRADLRGHAPTGGTEQPGSNTEAPSVKGLGKVKAQVFAVKDKQSESLLTPDEIRAYCSRLFEIKVEESTNQRSVELEPETIPIQEASDPPNRMLMLPEEAKVIRYQLPPVEGDPNRKQPKEGVINLTGKSFVCILHEYCQTVIRSPPTYRTTVVENDPNPFHLTVSLDGTPYATGVGLSKKQARQEAARKALSRLIPDFDKIVGSVDLANGPTINSERDLQLFDDISLTDPRLYEMSIRMALPTPHNLLVECLNRSCVPESDLKANMISHGRNKHFFTLQLREHFIKIPCRNKREGRHMAAQHLLARLHPEVTVWGGILRMYGPGTKPDKRGELETIQGAQNQEKSAVKTSLIRLLKIKMRELADQWEKGGNSIQPKGKFFVASDNLPMVTFHPDSQTDIYSSIPAPASSSPPVPSPSTKQ